MSRPREGHGHLGLDLVSAAAERQIITTVSMSY
jgi:hypothetical protein